MDSAKGIRLGRLFGIEILLDWSLLLIFCLITLSLAAGFPRWHPDWGLPLVWATALVAALLFFVSILLHELSHALVGRRQGIEVRRIWLFMFGGMAQMENEAPNWRAELAMAIVGPVTSLVLGILFLWLAGLVAGPIPIDPENPARTLASLSPLATLLLWLGPVNILLAIFNMMPGFPLDGGRVLRSLLWGMTGDLLRATRLAAACGQGFGWLLMACGLAMILGLSLPLLGGGLLNGLWLLLIGWFLNSAAVQSYQQLILHRSLDRVPVSRLMRREFQCVEPDLGLNLLVEEYVMGTGQRVFPVLEGQELVGIVSLSDLGRRERHQWPWARVRDVMTPRERLVVLTPAQDGFSALATLGRHNLNQAPVLDRGRLVGLLHREDILKWMFLHREMPGDAA